MSGGGSSHVFGRYQIEALVGRGGMAEVFRARCLSGARAGQKVAIKRLLPQLANDAAYVEMFVTEADLSRMLHHPNIVEVYEAGELDGHYFMVMEYVDGRDLGQILKRCRDRHILLPIDFAVFLGVTLLEALGFAHAAAAPSGKPLGIVHRDISPSNLFISRTGEIKLGDFGIAKARGIEQAVADDVLFGKAYYLSPEALEGRTDPAADLWAAAVVLYELLSGQRPFGGANPEQLASAIRSPLRRSVRALRAEVVEALDRAVMRGLAADEQERYPDAAAFAEALQPHYDERIGTPLAIAAVVRGLFGA